MRQGELLGLHFDRIFLFEDHYLRGRQAGEIIALFRQGASGGKRVKEIREVQGAVPAMAAPEPELVEEPEVVDEAEAVEEPEAVDEETAEEPEEPEAAAETPETEEGPPAEAEEQGGLTSRNATSLRARAGEGLLAGMMLPWERRR